MGTRAKASRSFVGAHALCTFSLRRAVRRSLQAGAGVIAASVMLGAAPCVSAETFPALFPLGSLLPAGGGDGSEGFVLSGIDVNDHAGRAVSAAGDVNGDGIGDVIIGAYHGDPGNRADAGESYVLFGRAGGFPANFELGTLLPGGGGDGSAGFIIAGIDPGDLSGSAVSAAGDVNGDGIDDLIVGAYAANPGGRDGAGESYVVFGRSTAQGAMFPAMFALASLLPDNGGNGSKGFIINGIDASDRSAVAVSAAGDVNGDGIGDLIIGADLADPGGRSAAGESYVLFGRNTAVVGNFPPVVPLAALLGGDGSAGFVLSGIDPFDYSGVAATAAGDVNGDGIDDLIIGTNGADPRGRAGAGEAYVVFGRDVAQVGNFPSVFPLASLLTGDGSTGFVLNGIDSRDYAGRTASGAGDLNGDGIDDVIIGADRAAPGGRAHAGECYVVFGRDTAQTGNFPAVFPLESLLAGGGDIGFVLNGIDARDYASSAVNGAGDINGDGLDDLLIGADRADPNGRTSAGETYVVFGRDTAQSGNFPSVFPLSALLPGAGGDGSTGFIANGIDMSDRAASALSAAGDVNGDGIGDLLIGAFGADPDGRADAGESYAIFGRGSLAAPPR